MTKPMTDFGRRGQLRFGCYPQADGKWRPIIQFASGVISEGPRTFATHEEAEAEASRCAEAYICGQGGKILLTGQTQVYADMDAALKDTWAGPQADARN